jgi:hypothetical protein
MDKEAIEKIELIIVKIWDMAIASVSPLAKPEDEQIVRTNTL